MNLWCLLALVVCALARGGQASAAPVPIPLKISDQNKLTFSLPYSLGTHTGRVTRLEAGSVLWDKDSKVLSSLELSFRVSDIDMDGAKLKCHMREALELDYEASEFPESHVCMDNQLPKNGTDSSRYPVVRFKSRPDDALNLKGPEDAPKTLIGVLTLHGVSQEAQLSLTRMKEESGRIHIKGNTSVPLPSFGITVKPFLFVTVADQAKVEWEFTLDLP